MGKEINEDLEGYVRFLEDAASVDVPSQYTDAVTPIVAWRGEKPFPALDGDAELDSIAAKFTKKVVPDEGTDDPTRDEDCPECEKKIQEIYRELGLSPLDLLESDDADEDEEDDTEEHEDSESKDDEKKEHEKGGEEEKPAEGNPLANLKKESVQFTAQETKILEQLISEMGLMEEELSELEEALDEFSDEDVESIESDIEADI